MIKSTVIQVTKDGKSQLPPEIRSRLQTGDEFMWEEEKDTIILRRVTKSFADGNEGEKVVKKSDGFFEIAERLAELNEIMPITEEEIQEEIRAYKEEKRKRT